MKWNLPYVYILSAICTGCASGPLQPKSVTPAPNGDSLVLQVKAVYAGAVGWSELYKCDIQQVLKGSIQQRQILLYTGTGKEFNETVEQRDPAALHILGLYRYRPEPDPGYSTGPGFRDAEDRSWLLTYIR